MPISKTGFELNHQDFVTLERKLQRMQDSSQAKKIRNNALKEGARTVRDAVRDEIDRIPDDDLRESGKTRFKKSFTIQQRAKRKDFGEVAVGPAFSGKKYTAPDFHLFEYGTAERITASGASRGRIRPIGMFRKGWKKSRDKAMAEVAQELKKLIDVAT